jgi:hypothetical protein
MNRTINRSKWTLSIAPNSKKIGSYFHSVHATSQFLTVYFLVTSLLLSLVSGAYLADVHISDSSIPTGIWSQVPQGHSIPRHIDLTVSRKVNSTSTSKGDPVVSDEKVVYGYESSITLATDRFHYKLQTSPLIREGAPRRRAMQFSDEKKK